MVMAKHCLKNPKCRLWQVLCDGEPCLVESEIEFNSNANTRDDKMSLSRFEFGEIIDLAVNLDEISTKFYKKISRKAVNRKVRKLLHNLAGEGKEHQAKLTELGMDLALIEMPESCREHFDYVAGTIETHMLNGGDEINAIVKGVDSGLDIIKLATDLVKDTILFLNGFRNVIPEEKRSVVDDLIIQEQIHLVKLIKLRKEFIIQDNKSIMQNRINHKNNRHEAIPLVI